MKVRIGFGLGTGTQANDRESFATLVDELERLGFDSLWVSDRLSGPAPDPVAAMSFAAGRTQRLKFGMSVMVLPGRNPVQVAKSLASVDVLSAGRLLPAFGLGAADPVEHQAFGVRRQDRAALFDEMLPIIRRLWAGDAVDHDGTWTLDALRIHPLPVQQPLDVWLGGIAPSELRRAGRLGDGWLPSFCTVADVATGIPAVRAEAERHGRKVDEEHYGALLIYAEGKIPDALAAVMAKRRPGIDPADVVCTRATLRQRVEQMIDVGASKFVVVPITEPEDWQDELGQLADDLLPLEN